MKRSQLHRRHFLRRSLVAAPLLWTPGAFAEALTKTPRQAEGPFYPDKLPLDTDNDLLLVNDSITPAVGEVTHFSGTVKSTAGSPVRGATVEIWQADIDANYIHSESRGSGNLDKNFQGYGRFLTGSTGEYYFRCLKPTPYTRRAPHIHVAVTVKGKRVLTTQCYIRGHELNENDFLLNRAPADMRHLLIVDFTPVPGSEIGELAARFDIVIGLTPED
jgi:protocatechuate 3,4-dioxygenase beta subunit